MGLREIEKIKEPSIVLSKIEIPDIETQEGQNLNGGIVDKTLKLSKLFGTQFPLILIDNHIWDANKILSMDIYSHDILPTISLRLVADSIWIEEGMTNDKQIISVYLDSRHPELKPLRNDYIITYSSLDNGYLTLSGHLDIPSYQQDKIQSISGTSKDVFEKISQQYNLGWSTNVQSTNDDMKWLQLSNGLEDYIKEIYTSAYSDDQTYFDCWIDIYYILNFIDVTNTFSEKSELDKGWIDSITYIPGSTAGNKSDKNYLEDSIMLTNMTQFAHTSYYVKDVKHFNNSGYIENLEGEKRNIQFYDLHGDQKFDIEVKSDSSVKNISGNKNKKKWLGILDTDNMHKNYLWSKSYSRKLKKEIEKKYIEVTLPTLNFNLFRGMRIPYMAMIENYDFSTSNLPFKIDKSLNGWYTIGGISYHYTLQNGLYQKIKLLRKDWPTI